MRVSRLAAVLVLAASATLHAELTLFHVDADLKEIPAGNRIVMPEVAAGDFADMRLRVRNTGSSNEYVSSFLVRGAGFSLLGSPGLPWLLVPGLNLDVRLRFQPTGSGTYSGMVLLNGAQVLVTGSSPEGAALWVQNGGTWRMVSNAEEIDFGRIQAHSKSTLLFAFRNPSLSPVNVRSVLLAPGAFELTPPLSLPLTIDPGVETQFAIAFSPTRGGVFRNALEVDGRTVTLAGNAYEPPLPEPLLSFASPEFASGRQQILNIRLAEPARGNGTMRLTLTFTPKQGLPDDPAVQFIANSTRIVSFTVRPGDEALRWNGDPDILFQTGTTAGLIRFSIAYDSASKSLDFAVEAAPPYLETARLLRSASTISLTLSGYDNARSMTTLAFTWYHKDGSIIGGGPIVSQVGTIFANYFRNAIGSGFAATASFPVSGSPENVTGLEIEAANGVGSTRTHRIAF